MQKYTLAFIFNLELSKVLLIKKNRPEWQKGFFNGIGGKVEENETPLECIVREINEETNLSINSCEFIHCGDIISSTYNVTIYTLKLTDSMLNEYKSNTDEIVELCNINIDENKLLPSVYYLIPLCKVFNYDLNINSFNLYYK